MKKILTIVFLYAAGMAFAGTPCGTNLEYVMDGTVLRLISPDPTQPATIETEAFKGNTTITSVTLPENVTQVGSQAFMGCTALAEVELGNVQDISTCAFKGCTALTEVTLPLTVTNIGVEAFRGCSSLNRVYCRPYTAPTLETDGFTDCANDLIICVPALASYNHETNWLFFAEHNQLGVCFLDENDEQTMANGKILAARDTYHLTEIEVFRTLRKAGCFNTLTLPFNVPDIEASPLAGAEVCEFMGATVLDGALQFNIKPLTGAALTAGTPYLIQWPDNGEVMTHLHFEGITWDDDQTADNAGTGEVLLHGFYGKTHISDETDGETHMNLFLQGGNELYWPTDGENANAKMLGFRAWFQITGSSVAGSPVRRGMPATLHMVSSPTGMEEVQKDEVQCSKEIRNGQIVIIRNGQVFSANGQRL